MDARDEAIEAMRSERGRHVLKWADARYGDRRINAACLCGEWRMGVDSRDLGDLHVDFARHIEAHVLDAIFSPGIEKGPIAYLAADLQQVGWAYPIRGGQWMQSACQVGTNDVPLYRLPNESPKGGA